MDENTTISDKIDGIIFPLPFEDKIKCWELIEELITERIEETKVKKFSISDVRSSSFDDVLKEYGRDEIIRVLYLWTPFRRSSGDLERMTNEELEFHWKEVVKNYYF
jgi:hypothetical protein